ncbi:MULTISPECIES: serine/threonine protein kinase [unclassified Brevundimonas]|uniref:serine/threonine protein kinase n=1 Tax=unclassified Brevundimonas TaxID=2622653 RepID=UPI0025BEC2E9|nr:MULTISPECIES: protein kinase [unclassified Brevundimonas]
MNLDHVKKLAADLVAEKGWELVDYIDAGASGAVFEIKHPEHGPAALKVYDPSFFEGDDAAIEVRRVVLQEELKGHGNKYLVEIFEIGEYPAGETHYLIMELCPWKTLDKHIAELPDDRVEDLLRQLVEAVRFLDSRQLVHRDIKPANIAIAPDFSQLKLLDLGVLRRMNPEEGGGTDSKRFVATTQYSPPEYLSRDEAKGEEGFEALNVYQVGAVLHDMIMKRPIFDEEVKSKNKYVLFKAVTFNRPMLFNKNLPARLVSLCRAALQKDPAKRLAGVKLSDLAQPVDSTEAVRRRLAAQRPDREPEAAGPSLRLWTAKVAGWIRSALDAEKAIIGPHLLKAEKDATGVSWTLQLKSLGLELCLRLERAEDGPYLALSIDDGAAAEGAPLLEIYEEGPGLEKEAIVGQLRELILFALDAAQDGETEEETTDE